MKRVLFLVTLLGCSSSTSPANASIAFDQSQYVVVAPTSPGATVTVPAKIIVRRGDTTFPSTVVVNVSPSQSGCSSPGVYFTAGPSVQMAGTSADSLVLTPTITVCPVPGATGSGAYLKGSTQITASYVSTGSTTVTGTATVVVQ